MTKKEYARITGRDEEDAPDDGNAPEGGEEGENGEKRQKVPNLYRQMKAKIQKLIKLNRKRLFVATFVCKIIY